MTQSPLVIVRAWQEKSAVASFRSKDLLTSALNKGFNAIAALLNKDSAAEDVQCALEYLSSERSLALKFDKSKDDSLRDIVYGLLESMHVSLNEWNEERNQRKDIGEISTQTDEFTISFLRPIIPSYEASLPMDNHSSNNLSTLANPSPTITIEPKEEPIDIHQFLPEEYQISASELMRDEKMIMKEEKDNQHSDPISPDSMDCISTVSLTADFTHSLLPFNPREEPREQTVPEDNKMPSLLFPPPSIIPPQEAVHIDFVHLSENLSTLDTRDSMVEEHNDVMPPSDFMENQMNFADENFADHDLVLSNPSNEVSMSTNDMDESGQTQRDSVANDLIDIEGEEEEEEEAMGEPVDTAKDDSETANVEKRKRSSRYVPRPTQYAESMGHSNDDGGPSIKKSRSASTSKADNKRASIKGEEKSESGRKKLTVLKENDTDLECPECEFRTRFVKTWMTHLRNKHSTNPALAGLALLCECGSESLSEAHSRNCNHVNTTVIRKRDGPIGRLDDEKTTPQCVICEAYPKTAYGYTHHLQIHHKSTLAQNGIFLMCSCGVELRSHYSRKQHLNECNPRQFTLHKLDEE